MTINKLLFIDTNIWLDFYRSRTDAGIKLLKQLEKISDQIIVTYQVEAEFKTNRQNALKEGLQELNQIKYISRPAIFSDAQAVKTIRKKIGEANTKLKDLEAKFYKSLKDPAKHDPVYQICQRIFHKKSIYNLERDNPIRSQIRRRAYKRFLHGCPPKKKDDTSIGDAFNWEWMIECANQNNADLVIVSRDADYGITIGKQCFINDHLKQEFSERVSRKKKITLYTNLTDALQHLNIKISAKEKKEEQKIIDTQSKSEQGDWQEFIGALEELLATIDKHEKK